MDLHLGGFEFDDTVTVLVMGSFKNKIAGKGLLQDDQGYTISLDSQEGARHNIKDNG